MNTKIIFDTSIASHNMGDNIIMQYVYDVVDELFPSDCFVKLSSHEYMGKASRKLYQNSDFSIVGGTNLLTSKMLYNPQWKLNPIDLKMLRNVILLGVGWSQYDDRVSAYTKMMLKNILSKKYLMSVRDSYTEKKLRDIGIDNVVNTSCVTTWSLTSSFCQTINKNKTDNVITTVTNYRKNVAADKIILDTLEKLYKEVYVWIQSTKDCEYLMSFYDIRKLHIISPNVKSFEQALEMQNVDYVGTRLHAGIHALNHRVRTIIIGIDNRAIEISRDINLPVINRNRINNELDKRIMEPCEYDIKIPEKNIALWKEQF